MVWTVTRQVYWPDGTRMVEVARGGTDDTGPDMLVEHYPGEGETFNDPREAVETAAAIAAAWRSDCRRRVSVGMGSTWGGSLPLEPSPLPELRRAAKVAFEKLPKCDHCGSLLPEHPWRSIDDPDLGDFCREFCVEEAMFARFDLDTEDDTEGEDGS